MAEYKNKYMCPKQYIYRKDKNGKNNFREISKTTFLPEGTGLVLETLQCPRDTQLCLHGNSGIKRDTDSNQ